MREPDQVTAARHALGTRLAAYRRAAGLTQAQLAKQAVSSRSTIANVETGHQRCTGQFWAIIDPLVHADGALVAEHEQVEAAARRAHTGALLPAVASAIRIPDQPEQNAPWTAPSTEQRNGTGIDLVTLAAAQARDHAMRTAASSVGPSAMEQLTAEVTRLSRAYVTGAPLPLFLSMHDLLTRIQTFLEARLYPAQAQDLTFLAGALSGLMSNAALDLGMSTAADDLARAARTYATVIQHRPLIAWARGAQALTAIWDHRYPEAIAHTEDGLSYLPTGMGAARLHAIRARALTGQHDTTPSPGRPAIRPDRHHPRPARPPALRRRRRVRLHPRQAGLLPVASPDPRRLPRRRRDRRQHRRPSVRDRPHPGPLLRLRVPGPPPTGCRPPHARPP